MSSIDEQTMSIVGKTHIEKIQFLTNLINDPSVNDNQKLKSREARIDLNYKQKNWQNVLDDIAYIEGTTNSTIFSLLKAKASLLEYCRKSRLCILETINNEFHTEEHEAFVINISETNIEQLINRQLVPKRVQSSSTRNKKSMMMFGGGC